MVLPNVGHIFVFGQTNKQTNKQKQKTERHPMHPSSRQLSIFNCVIMRPLYTLPTFNTQIASVSALSLLSQAMCIRGQPQCLHALCSRGNKSCVGLKQSTKRKKKIHKTMMRSITDPVSLCVAMCIRRHFMLYMHMQCSSENDAMCGSETTAAKWMRYIYPMSTFQ